MRSSKLRFWLPFVPSALLLLICLVWALRAIGCIHYDAPVVPDGLGLPPAMVVFATIRD